jgi:hypothetical protein
MLGRVEIKQRGIKVGEIKIAASVLPFVEECILERKRF